MSQHYIFNEAGCIPGVPGIFANCRVEVTDSGNLWIGPLHSEGFMPTITSVLPPISAPQEDAPTNVASEPEPEPEPALVEAPAPEPQPEPTSEPTSPPAFNGG